MRIQGGAALLAEVVEHLGERLLVSLATDDDLRGATSSAEVLRLLWHRWKDPKERRQFLLLAEIYGSPSAS